MAEHNHLLRAARERRPSPAAPGAFLSRSELAEAVNAWLWVNTGRRYELDGHHIAKYERGVVRYPIAPYRSALRVVLGAVTDAELGFVVPRREHRITAPLVDSPWDVGCILDGVSEATGSELLNRRDVLRSGAAAVAGAALLGPLQGWLEPLVGWPARAGAAFSLSEVEAVEHVVRVFAGWRSAGSALGCSAVLGQLVDVTERLRGAPDEPLTRRVYLAGSELAKIAGSMAFDAEMHGAAQRHYTIAVQLAKAAGEDSFGAVVLAALARQSYDAGQPNDGLELVQLARHGSRLSGTPGLTAMLATREAWGHALNGQVFAFRRAVGVAEEAFAKRDADREPRWLNGLDIAELLGTIGARFRDLAQHDTTQARHAVTYIERALTLRGSDRPRNRAMDLVGLGRVHLLTGEPERGCALVAEAVPLVDPRRPGRLARKLRDFDREASRYAQVPAVRELREQLRDHASV